MKVALCSSLSALVQTPTSSQHHPSCAKTPPPSRLHHRSRHSTTRSSLPLTQIAFSYSHCKAPRSSSSIARRGLAILAATGENGPVVETVTSKDAYNEGIAAAGKGLIVIGWVAGWCRKCIYLKPKLNLLAENMAATAKFMFVDVNAVPGDVVRDAGVTKLPTIQVWRDGEKLDELICGEGSAEVVKKVRAMIQAV